MATGLALWEVDPLFPAAEEVQNSTDRMESIFRSWKHTQGIAQSAPEDAYLISAAATDKRDLVTALDTVRWQLEDFARAVKDATKSEYISSRYSQFVRAIQSQVCNVDSELGSQEKRYARIEEAESECLANFLSGSSIDLEADIEVKSSDEEEKDEEDDEDDTLSPSTSASNVSSGSTSASNVSSRNGHVQQTGNGLGQPVKNGFHQTGNGFQQQVKNGYHAGNGYHQQQKNGDSYSGLMNQNGARDPDSASSSSSSRISRLSGWWRWWRGRSNTLRLQMSNSVLKRWKDGDSGGFLKCISSSFRNGFEQAGDIEQGFNSRKVNGSSCSSYSPPGSSSRLTGIEKRLQRAHQSIPFGNAVQISVGALVVVGLMGLYFRFLSTLVPYDHQPVPGSFLN